MQICVLNTQQADAFQKFHQLLATPLGADPRVRPALAAARGQCARVNGRWQPLGVQQALAFQLDAERRRQLAALARFFDCSHRAFTAGAAFTHSHVRGREAEELLAAHPRFVRRLPAHDGRPRLRVPDSAVLRILRQGQHPVCVLQTADLPAYNLGKLDCAQHKHITAAAADERLCICCSPVALNDRHCAQQSRSAAIAAGHDVDFSSTSHPAPSTCRQLMRPGSPYGAPVAARLSPRHIVMMVAYELRCANNIGFAVKLRPGQKTEAFPVPGFPTLQLVRL